jgi:hypothetical protein
LTFTNSCSFIDGEVNNKRVFRLARPTIVTLYPVVDLEYKKYFEPLEFVEFFHELPNSNSNINADLAVLHQFENK